MKIKRALLTGLVLFIAFALMESLVNCVLLKGMYQATASLWRPMDDMQQIMWMVVLAQAIFGFVLAIIYACGYERKKGRLRQGLRFGLLFALLLAPYMSLMWYVVLPIPGMLAVYWCIVGFVEMPILGMLAGITYEA